MFGLKPKDTPEVAVTIRTGTFIRLAALTVATVVLLMAIQKAAHALLLIFIALFLALALNAPVHWVSRHLPKRQRGNRTLATALSFLFVVLVLGAFLASVTPPLVRQTDNFIGAAPDLVSDFRSQNSETGRFIRKYHLQKQVNNFSDQLSERLNHIGGTAFDTAQRVGSSAFSLVTILVLTFMMLIEGPRWLRFMRDIIPKDHHSMLNRLAEDMYKVVKGFVNGQVLLAALAALFILPAILVLHISYPIALIGVVFICGLIPMVGHFIGATIVTIVALFHSTSSAIFILAYYILYQQIENYMIQPKVQANSTNMSPLLVFMSVVIGVSFGGLVGGLVAIPVAGCIRVAVLEYLHHQKILSDNRFKEITNETK